MNPNYSSFVAWRGTRFCDNKLLFIFLYNGFRGFHNQEKNIFVWHTLLVFWTLGPSGGSYKFSSVCLSNYSTIFSIAFWEGLIPLLYISFFPFFYPLPFSKTGHSPLWSYEVIVVQSSSHKEYNRRTFFVLMVWRTKNIVIILHNSYIYMKHGEKWHNHLFLKVMLLYFSINWTSD